MNAQIQFVDPRHLLEFTIIAGFFAVLYYGWRAATRRADTRRQIEPQPLEVRPAAEFVPLQQCRAAHVAMADRLDRIEREMEEHRERLRAEVAALHEKVNRVAESVAALGSASSLHQDSLRVIQGDIKLLLARVPGFLNQL